MYCIIRKCSSRKNRPSILYISNMLASQDIDEAYHSLQPAKHRRFPLKRKFEQKMCLGGRFDKKCRIDAKKTCSFDEMPSSSWRLTHWLKCSDELVLVCTSHVKTRYNFTLTMTYIYLFTVYGTVHKETSIGFCHGSRQLLEN